MTKRDESPAAPGSKLLAYLRLFRFPNVFTAMADITMGFLFVHDSLAPQGVFACLLVASCLLYTAGMVLNDVYDFSEDARDRPERPLPSGQIPLGRARWMGYQMLALGIGFSWLASFLNLDSKLFFRSGVVGTLLAVCVVLYDAVLKRTFVGPLAMGACRFLNVLLGMSMAQHVVGNKWVLGYDASELVVAGGIGVYVTGITWFARHEAGKSSRLQLGMALTVMVAGILLLGAFPSFGDGESRLVVFEGMPHLNLVWPALLLLLSITIVRRCATAIVNPKPERIQMAVKLCIISLIVFDAAVCFAVQGTVAAVAVIALLVPMLILGRWVYST